VFSPLTPTLGNDNRDACQYSPAAAENAVTVGASTLSDERAYFSNHGPCVDVFAPGLNILSTWTGSDHAVNVISGTSMASPHTAGLLAYLLSIYPSEQFDPPLSLDLFPVVYAPEVSLATESISTLYALTHAVLPSWASRFLLPPRLVEIIAPAPPKRPAFPTTKQLKNALIALSTKGVLSELPTNTSNLLIFNNATTA
jgi:cerevisin